MYTGLWPRSNYGVTCQICLHHWRFKTLPRLLLIWVHIDMRKRNHSVSENASGFLSLDLSKLLCFLLRPWKSKTPRKFSYRNHLDKKCEGGTLCIRAYVVCDCAENVLGCSTALFKKQAGCIGQWSRGYSSCWRFKTPVNACVMLLLAFVMSSSISSKCSDDYLRPRYRWPIRRVNVHTRHAHNSCFCSKKLWSSPPTRRQAEFWLCSEQHRLDHDCKHHSQDHNRSV